MPQLIFESRHGRSGPAKGAEMIQNCIPRKTGFLKTALIPAAFAAMAAVAVPAQAQQTGAEAKTVPAEQAAIDPATTVVATVNGEPIYLAEILAQIQQLPQQYQQAPMEQIYPPMLDRAIDARLIANAAREAGLQDRDDVKARVAQAETEIISEVFLTEKVSAQVGEEKLRARYEAQIADSASQGEEVKARHILVTSEEEARAIIEELKKGADFAELAKEKSTGPSGSNGGDLGYFTKEAMVAPFSEAAFALEPGSFTVDPVQTQFGWHVILVEDRRAVEPPSFAQMQPQLAQELTREILAETVEGLRNGVEIMRFGPDGSALQ
ncbi:peptidylprolyl isomerase [Nisaea acidiphila]|uniref:Parvulin-like PPIase n=1 Tax=Nisaea acidiphila TaxID=1862145 RepID=A0A9J7AYA8_9PROT|nr:peptidylprolyl isomerase [Nisaea acidiphila]UUX51409.1 peptidylprolyl isomerase [Nisaea acidiphila]